MQIEHKLKLFQCLSNSFIPVRWNTVTIGHFLTFCWITNDIVCCVRLLWHTFTQCCTFCAASANALSHNTLLFTFFTFALHFFLRLIAFVIRIHFRNYRLNNLWKINQKLFIFVEINLSSIHTLEIWFRFTWVLDFLWTLFWHNRQLILHI